MLGEHLRDQTANAVCGVVPGVPFRAEYVRAGVWVGEGG